MATTTRIEVYKGEEVTFQFTMNPVEDVSGWTLAFTVARKLNVSNKLIGPIAGQIVNGVGGIFKFVLDADDTDELKPGEYVYDAWRTDSEFERVLAIGEFALLGTARLPPAP